MRLFKITTPEGEMYVIVHASEENIVRNALENFASKLSVNPLGVYFTEIETYHLYENE